MLAQENGHFKQNDALMAGVRLGISVLLRSRAGSPTCC